MVAQQTLTLLVVVRFYYPQPIFCGHRELVAFSGIVRWVIGSPERSPTNLDVVIAEEGSTPKSEEHKTPPGGAYPSQSRLTVYPFALAMAKEQGNGVETYRESRKMVFAFGWQSE